eukprot:365661-Chlamydomonas_euryale.AAC.38
MSWIIAEDHVTLSWVRVLEGVSQLELNGLYVWDKVASSDMPRSRGPHNVRASSAATSALHDAHTETQGGSMPAGRMTPLHMGKAHMYRMCTTVIQACNIALCQPWQARLQMQS